MHSVFCFGEALIDFIPNDEGCYMPLVGGAPANVAAALAKLGANSHFIGGISTDAFGTQIQVELSNLGVQLQPSLLTSKKTAMVVVSLDDEGERTFQFYRDETADLSVTEAKLSTLDWSNIGIFHFCSNTLTDNTSYKATLYALAKAEARQATISFDVNLRLNLWPDNSAELILERFNKVAGYCTIIKFSEDELLYLSDVAQIEPNEFIQKLLAQNVNMKLVLVTAGGKPVEVITEQGRLAVEPPKTTVIDTTGGGDSFIGGFLYQLSLFNRGEISSLLSDLRFLQEATKFATQCGAFTVARKGAIRSLPSLRDLM